MSNETRAYQGKGDAKPLTAGWMISEIYDMVNKIQRHLGVEDEPSWGEDTQPQRKPVNEQVAYLEGQLQTCREDLQNANNRMASYVGANLGMATTEEMMRELIVRFKMNMYGEHTKMLDFERALVLAEMLGSMSALEREYRTVDGG